MTKLLSFFVALSAVIINSNIANAAYCNGSPDAGERTNDFPIFNGEMKFIRSVKNAMLFETGPPNATFPVVHLWGNPYEVGYAQGKLIGPLIKDFVYKTWAYLSEELINELDGDLFPEWAKKMIVQKGLDRALDWTRDTTAAFTPQAYFDEVRGIADATGIDYDLLYRLQMFPELTKASCSFFGAWENAVGNTGHSYQLRALDFDTTGPFKDFPQLTVYHPSEGHAYAQIGWPGNVGVLSGFSDQQLAISENMVNGIEFSGYVAIPYDDVTLLPVNDTWHPKIDDVVYNGMDWLCPGYTGPLGDQLQKYHGSISEVNTIQNILPTVQTGDLHAVVYDLTEQLMHVSFCRRGSADPSEPHYAYERQFTRLNMKDIFAQQAPVV